MRIIFLNTWFGTTGNPLFDFIKEKSKETDIFCFMEVTPKLYFELSSILKDFSAIYDKGHFLKPLGDFCGQAIFVSEKIKIKNSGKVSIYKELDKDVGFLQFSELASVNNKLCIGSIHGKTFPGDKLDSTIRLKQSQTIIDFFADKNGPKIIGGDFNLSPNTESVRMFEKAGYRNLIKEFGIKTTRNHFSWEQFQNDADYQGKQYFADYCFVSPEVKVKNFEVPDIEVSDHLPLILDFEI